MLNLKYTKYFDQNGQYNAWNWTPWQKQEIGIGNQAKQAVQTTSDTSRLAMVGTQGNDKFSRTLQYQATPGRGYISYMRWDEKPYGNSTNDAYEHEILLNGINHGTISSTFIDSGNEATGCIPKHRYFASNLPYMYLDTRLDFDGSCDTSTGFPSFTIGTPQADEIQSNTYYFTYFFGDRGPTGIPNFAVFAQDSVRRLIGGTWGVYQKGDPLSPSDDAKKVLIDCYNTEPYNSNCSRVGNYPFWYEKREDGNYRFQEI